MKRILITVLVLVLCSSLVFTGCGEKKVVTKDDKTLNGEVVATIGGVKITQADYNFIYKLLYDNMSQYSMYYGEEWYDMQLEEGKTVVDYIKENTLAQHKQLAASSIIAKEYGLKINGDIKKAVAEQKENIIKNNYGSEEKYKEFLEITRTTDDAVNEYLYNYELYNKLFEKLNIIKRENILELIKS